MKNAPCKGCQKRHKACHDSCTEYKDWKSLQQEKNFQLQNLFMSDADKMHIDSVRKTRRKNNR